MQKKHARLCVHRESRFSQKIWEKFFLHYIAEKVQYIGL